jgi:enoyl-CoA hydratase/carnithine racemase
VTDIVTARSESILRIEFNRPSQKNAMTLDFTRTKNSVTVA